MLYLIDHRLATIDHTHTFPGRTLCRTQLDTRRHKLDMHTLYTHTTNTRAHPAMLTLTRAGDYQLIGLQPGQMNLPTELDYVSRQAPRRQCSRVPDSSSPVRQCAKLQYASVPDSSTPVCWTQVYQTRDPGTSVWRTLLRWCDGLWYAGVTDSGMPV